METYEEKYKDLVKRLNKAREEKGVYTFNSVLDAVAPELKIDESEDERIRKELIDFLEYYRLNNVLDSKTISILTDSVAWLEKQGDKDKLIKELGEYKVKYTQEVLSQKLGKQGEPTDIPADAVLDSNKDGLIADTIQSKPKFKVGEWLQYRNAKPFLVENVTEQGYVNGDSCLPFEWEDEIHLWTIQDAKCGDILVDDLGNICIYQEPSTKLMYHSFCYGNHKCFIDGEGSHKIVGTCPATKEQCDLLFQKIKEAGYEWDAEKKELKKIEQKPIFDVEIPFGTDSELVEKAITIPNGCYAIIEDNKVILRKGEKKSSWSEEDEDILNTIINHFKVDIECTDEDDTVRWLKSLKEKCTWKPSGEQMDALETAVSSLQSTALESLYNKLKKL